MAAGGSKHQQQTSEQELEELQKQLLTISTWTINHHLPKLVQRDLYL